MSKIMDFKNPFWKEFRLLDGHQRWFYTDDEFAIKLYDKEYFNKNTVGAIVYKGYETDENQTEAISEMIYYIVINYKTANYYGDARMHFKSKRYIMVDGKIYQQLPLYEVKEVNRIPKELKGVLESIS